MRKPAFSVIVEMISGFAFATCIESTICLLSKSQISRLYPSSVAGLCRTRPETQRRGFLMTQLILFLFGLRLYVPVNNFSVMSGRSHRFLGITSTFLGGKCILLKNTTRRPE